MDTPIHGKAPCIPPVSQVLGSDTFWGAQIGVISTLTSSPTRSGREMPKIPQNTLKCVVYMYEEEQAAKHGLEFGGTGFLVGYPSKSHPSMMHQYVVTNWHVAVRDKIQVVRTNRKDGTPYIRTINEWYHDYKLDIAVAPYPANLLEIDCAVVRPDFFLTKELAAERDIGPGEDVFMVGRFVDHDGGHTNRPAVRFGNISVMPTPLEQPTGVAADSFCIDMHSRPGYSGSPVFVFRTPGHDLTEINKGGNETKLLTAGVNFFGLLGIHYDQFPEPWPIVGRMGEMPPVKHDGPIIRGLSGMTKVLPAWSIQEILDLPILEQLRAQIEADHAKSIAMQGIGEANAASPASTPLHESRRSPLCLSYPNRTRWLLL